MITQQSNHDKIIQIKTFLSLVYKANAYLQYAMYSNIYHVTTFDLHTALIKPSNHQLIV